jgi:hypothetical protein
LPRRLTEYNLDPNFTEITNAQLNADTLNMIANNIRAGCDPVARLKTILSFAAAAQQITRDHTSNPGV